MTETREMAVCPRTDSPRADLGCLHCPWSLKVWATWWCRYGEEAAS